MPHVFVIEINLIYIHRYIIVLCSPVVWLSFLLDLCIIFSQVLKICCIRTATVVRLQHYKGGNVAFKRFIHISQLPHMLDWIIIISDNGLSPDWHQTITRIQRRNLINSQCSASRYGIPNTTGWVPEYFGVFLCRLTVYLFTKHIIVCYFLLDHEVKIEREL